MTQITVARIGKNQTVQYAAEEVYTYLKKIDPRLLVDVRVYSAYSADVTGVIWVGMSEAFEDKLLPVENPKLDDSICIDVKSNAGVITGTNPRAVLIAAYRFLKELGVAWVRPTDDGEIVPQYSVNELNVSIQEKASYRHRAICIEGRNSYEHVLNMIKWLPRVGMSGYYFQFFVPYHFFNNWYTHNYNKYFPQETISREEISALTEQLEEEIEKRDLILHKVGHGWSCEPFDIRSDGWFVVKDEDIPDKIRPYLALVNGKRTYITGKPVFTQLCYSNPWVRELMTDTAADYCAAHPNMRYLHFWLADGNNNHCECENCTQLPSEYQIMLLNLLDEKLTARGLDTKVVFGVCKETLWHPIRERLRNPERFVMMLAPISRPYSELYDEVQLSEDWEAPVYIRNKTELPEDLRTYCQFLKGWRDIDCFGRTDGVVYDYHLIWAHVRDPGYYVISKNLFRDMQALHKHGLNGMISCQVNGCGFPTNLPMQMMADALWDKNCDFEEMSSRYYASAFGPDGEAVKAYTSTISRLFDPDFPNRFPAPGKAQVRKPFDPEARTANMNRVKALAEEFGAVIARTLKRSLPDAQRRSWEYLNVHRDYIFKAADMVLAGVSGSMEVLDRRIEETKDWLLLQELALHKILDARNVGNNLKWVFKENVKAAMYE